MDKYENFLRLEIYFKTSFVEFQEYLPFNIAPTQDILHSELSCPSQRKTDILILVIFTRS